MTKWGTAQTYIQLHNCKSMIKHTFHPRSLLHFTPHFSLPRTFGRFVTALQKPFTSPHLSRGAEKSLARPERKQATATKIALVA